MTERHWKALLHSMTLVPGGAKLNTVSVKSLDTFEDSRGLKLPNSYRSYCSIFGFGQIAEAVNIAVPGKPSLASPFPFSLEVLNETAHDDLEYEEYSPSPEQHRRGLFVAYDIFRSYHFFDPTEITDPDNNEYAVYTRFDSWKVQRMADNFWLFVTECCLGPKHTLLYGESSIVEKVFEPV